MLEETVTYFVKETPCKGFLTFDNSSELQRPGIILAHAWNGLDEFAKNKARDLARLGYVAFVADVYGNGKKANCDNEALELMTPLFLDRSLLQERIQGAYVAIQNCFLLDKNNIAAIGFCFGGLTVIELLRSGTPIKGAVSFHGVLGDTLGTQKAQTKNIAPNIKGSLLLLHGHDDPLVTPEEIERLQKELSEANIDWQMHIYGQTSHAFTNPYANDISKGLIYNKRSAIRAWGAMATFLKEIFI